MTRANLVKQLLKAHAEGDETAFQKAALQLAANESKAGHAQVAEDLRRLVATMGPAGAKRTTVDIATPRGELRDLVEGGYRDERLRDVVLRPRTHEAVSRILRENRERVELENWGVAPNRKLLFCGPPGCGKTLTAQALAGELGMPLMTVRFDGLFSRYLGATSNHLKVLFEEMPRRPGVYFFDEFDAIAKSRGDANDVGEVRRVVTTFLQLMDADRSPSLIVAATNYEEILDRAVFRRFDVVIPFSLPEQDELEALLRLRLAGFDVPQELIRTLAARATSLSFADATRACDQAVKTMALDRRRSLLPSDLESAFAEAVARSERHKRLP